MITVSLILFDMQFLIETALDRLKLLNVNKRDFQTSSLI